MENNDDKIKNIYASDESQHETMAKKFVKAHGGEINVVKGKRGEFFEATFPNTADVDETLAGKTYRSKNWHNLVVCMRVSKERFMFRDGFNSI